MGQIRRLDDLGRIVIPRDIREQMGITEGTAFEFVNYSNDSITICKVNNKENIRNNIISLRNYIRACNEISDKTALELDEKLREINNIINMEDYKKKE